MDLKNNTILITGGTSGLGLEFAKQLISLGNNVIITGRNSKKLETVKSEYPQVEIFKSDVSSITDITQLAKEVITKFPALNILINNAGEMRKINLHSVADLNDLTGEIDINLSGPIRMINAFLPHLKKQNKSAIINVTSGLALVPFPIAPIYSATKAGLRSYTKSLRIQLRNTDVKVFEIIAPAAKTPLNDKFKNEVDSKTLMDADKLIAEAIRGISNDKFEVYPGMAKIIKALSNLAPNFLVNQLSKPVDKLLENAK